VKRPRTSTIVTSPNCRVLALKPTKWPPEVEFLKFIANGGDTKIGRGEIRIRK
jgi:hypothetical protein